MRLRGLHLSPYYERAYLVLEIKNATDKVELAGMPGGFGSDELLAESPMGKIPYLLLDDGTCLPEGQMIAEFFNRHFDGPDLEPEGALQAAQARLVARIVDLYIAPHSAALSRPMFGRLAPDEAAIAQALEEGLPKAFDFLDSALSGGPYAVADRLSFGDIALVPHIFFFIDFLAHYGFKPFDGRERLSAWWQARRDDDLTVNCHARIQSSLDAIRQAMK